MKHAKFIIAIGLILGSYSCDNDDNADTSTPTQGDIIGSVNLYDEGTTQVESHDMTVSIFGTNISAITDVDGRFNLKDVPFGTYDLSYEKSGYGTFKKFNINHESAPTTVITNTPSLGQSSTTAITDLQVSLANDMVTFSITTNPSGNSSNRRYIRYFLSADSSVSNNNYNYYSEGLVVQINPYEATLSSTDLINAGFTSGQTVYVKAYGESFWSNQYEDTTLQRVVFPNLNPLAADAVSFVVP
jgi:hypothetical protein